MSDTRVGVSFSEAMSGQVAMGAGDPPAGAASSQAATLVMRGDITVGDIDVFVENPSHYGKLDVQFDWPPFGSGLDGSGGVFNLFSPSDDPDLRLMVYEWPAIHQGRHYYFAGRKNVRHHPLRDAWSDTTTLYVQVHEGTNTSGALVASGILKLSMSDFVRMLTTFKAVEPKTPADSVRALTKFG